MSDDAPPLRRVAPAPAWLGLLLALLILGGATAARAGLDDVVDPPPIGGPTDPDGEAGPDTIDRRERSWDPGGDLDPVAGGWDEAGGAVTVSPPIELSVPRCLDSIVGATLGGALRSGLERLRIASVGIQAAGDAPHRTSVSVMPTGRFRASGRMAGSSVHGNAVLRRVDEEVDQSEALLDASLQLETDLVETLDADLHARKDRSRVTTGLDLRTRRGPRVALGYAHAWSFRPDQQRFAESRLQLTCVAVDHLRFGPSLYRRRYESGRTLRWVDWAVTVEAAALRGPLGVTWRRSDDQDIQALQHVVAVLGGWHTSWSVRRVSERQRGGRSGNGGDARHRHALGLGAEWRRGATMLYRIGWSHDRSSGLDAIRFDMTPTWHLGPVRIGGLRLAWRQLQHGRRELRLSATCGVPIRLEQAADGALRAGWGNGP
ncbi:MAG: hypothetical protein PVF43_13260 [Candidatus Eiseniibacteriota bacterium]